MALYRLDGGSELARVIREVIRTGGGTQPSARSHRECLQIVGDGDLTYAETHQVPYGEKFLIRADGRGASRTV